MTQVNKDVRMAEWSKAPDSSSGLRKRAWVQIPLLTIYHLFLHFFLKLTELCGPFEMEYKVGPISSSLQFARGWRESYKPIGLIFI